MKIDYNDNVIKTMSLADLESSILGYKKMFCKDGITANDIPVFVIDGCRDLYPLVINDETNLFDDEPPHLKDGTSFPTLLKTQFL